MAEPTQFTFPYQEVLAALVRLAGIKEGRWQLITKFGFGGANMGPNDDEIVPTAVVALVGIGIQRATETSPKALTIDAAEAEAIMSAAKPASE